MAGKITVSTINDSSGVLATQNGMTGIPKAWAAFTGSTGAITGSFNVSSITRNSTGDYTVNFTTAMANANYAKSVASSPEYAVQLVVCQTDTNTSLTETAPTTSAFRFLVSQPTGVRVDGKYVSVAIFGS